MSSRAASKSRWRREQRERHSRMCERSRSQGSWERSARSSASVEQRHRRVDRRELVAADAHAVEDVGALDVGKAGMLGEVARACEQVESRPKLAVRHPRPALGQERAELELAGLGRVGDAVERLERLVEPLALDRGLSPHDGGLDLGVLVPRLAGLEIRGVDAEPLCDPRERLRRRARLAALDLADVLLREAVAGEIGLGQARSNAQLSKPGTKTRRDALRRGRCKGAAFHVRPSTYRPPGATRGSLARVTRSRD